MLGNFRGGLALISIAAWGCPVRSTSRSTPPGSSVAQQSSEGVFGKTIEATVSDEDTVQSFRFDLRTAGGISATARPLNPQAKVILAIYAGESGNGPIATGEPGKKVETAGLQPGTYYVAVMAPSKDAVRTKVLLRVVYKPQDPDAGHITCKTRATARDLPNDSSAVEDEVDYSARRRTCFWHLPVTADGSLEVRFNNQGNNISADFVPAQGTAEKIDPVAGLSKADLPAGDYYVKVYADDAGDAGAYTLSANFDQGDTCKNGGPACTIEGAEDLKLPSDSKTAEVDYKKRKQFHFYRVSLKEKGKLTISFKVVQPPRGSKVQAFFMRTATEDGDKITGSPVTKDIDAPGDYYLRVQAPESADYGKYTLSSIWSPANFIPADVVEIGRSPCMLTVSAGSNQGVRQGLSCTVVSVSGQPLDSCVVDQTFPNLSKVRPGNVRCNLQQNAKVQINAQSP
jgi:hypothetical protein